MTKKQILHDMFCSGMTVAEIALIMGMGEKEVSQIIEEQEKIERQKWEQFRKEWIEACKLIRGEEEKQNEGRKHGR